MPLTPFSATTPPPPVWRDIYSVSRLTAEVRGLLEAGFPPLWIEAEISNLARPASGHLYFSLKDKKSQVRCAMFKRSTFGLGFEPANGQQVLVQARVGLYEARGEFQLVVEQMQPAGAGALQLAFEQLKTKLQAEGLFESRRKKSLPALPRGIGVITSATGAAIRDITTTLNRRFPAIPVVLYPVKVQGEGSAKEIAAAIAAANQRALAHAECDVLIVGRGGGSLEDLWAFNEEIVARAIAASELPIVSAVGHEVDTSIADFVADHRAATPTAAAEAVTPDAAAWLEKTSLQQRRLTSAIQRQLHSANQQHDHAQLRLQQQRPEQKLGRLQQQLLQLRQRLSRHQSVQLAKARQQLLGNQQRLRAQHPAAQLGALQIQQKNLQRRLISVQQRQLADHRNTIESWQPRLQHAQHKQLQTAARRLSSASAQLGTLSPLATVARGYAIATLAAGTDHADSSHHPVLLTSAAQAPLGSSVELQLGSGRLGCVVQQQYFDDHGSSTGTTKGPIGNKKAASTKQAFNATSPQLSSTTTKQAVPNAD